MTWMLSALDSVALAMVDRLANELPAAGLLGAASFCFRRKTSAAAEQRLGRASYGDHGSTPSLGRNSAPRFMGRAAEPPRLPPLIVSHRQPLHALLGPR